MPRDVVLGWDDPIQYCANAQHTYFGATIGRVANRIAHGSFELGGKTYHTPLNEKVRVPSPGKLAETSPLTHRNGANPAFLRDLTHYTAGGSGTTGDPGR